VKAVARFERTVLYGPRLMQGAVMAAVTGRQLAPVVA
jgi:hypothetical protein